jgi:hypothetical protein
MKNSESETAPAIDRGCLNLLDQHQNGSIISDVSEAYRKVVEATQLTGKGGEVTLKIKITPPNKTVSRFIGIAMEVTTKIPKAPPYISIWYVGNDGELLRDDPNQQKLDLRVVETNPAVIGGAK